MRQLGIIRRLALLSVEGKTGPQQMRQLVIIRRLALLILKEGNGRSR
jgi:hypothetical protein